MADEQEKSDLNRIVELFQRHDVEFLVIGGQAETLFGSARVTFDVDLCYRRDAENLERLARALKELKPTLRGAPPDLPFQIDARSLALGANFTFDTNFGPLDLLGYVEPIGNYEALIAHAESYPIGSYTVRTISLDDLIRVKEHIRRTKDRDSLLQLQAIKRLRES
jgi:predicted nucleotidyltransferase